MYNSFVFHSANILNHFVNKCFSLHLQISDNNFITTILIIS